MFASDFDGTLAPVTDHPGEATMPPEKRGVLIELAEFEHVSIAIPSGRSVRDLKARVNLNAILVGDHGLEVEFADPSLFQAIHNFRRRRGY